MLFSVQIMAYSATLYDIYLRDNHEILRMSGAKNPGQNLPHYKIFAHDQLDSHAKHL